MTAQFTKRRTRSLLVGLALACLCAFWLALPPAWARSPGGPGGGGGDDSSGPEREDDSHESEPDDSDNSGSGNHDDDGPHDDEGNSGSSESGSNSGPSGDEDHSGSNSGHGSLNSGSDDSSGPSGNAGPGGGHEGVAVRLEHDDDGGRIVGGEVVMVSALPSAVEKVSAAGLTVIESVELTSVGLRLVRVALPKDLSVQQVVNKLQRIDARAIVTLNHVYTPAAGSRVQLAAKDLMPSGAPMHGSIGLVDAGVDARHPMLRAVTVTTRNFGSASRKPEPHGTAVASRIAATAPGANIVVANVFAEMSDGQEIASADAIARGLDWLAQANVAVINLSLTGPRNPILEAIAAKLTARGHILVAAVGNEGPQAPPQYPAAYAQVVGVTAVDAQAHVYRYANQGDYVDFAAPGVDTRVAVPAGASEVASGTSYAAPIVAVALARRLDRPNPAKAKAALAKLEHEAVDLGIPGRDPIYGFGLVRPIF